VAGGPIMQNENGKIKILGINSSLREKSHPISQHESFTRKLLIFGLEYIQDEHSDVETEVIDLGKYNIQFVPGAYSTNEHFLKLETAIEDDMQLLYPKVVAADGIIFSSPTYWGYPSGLLKVFLERLTVLDEISDDPADRKLQGKVAGAIATAKFDGSSRTALDILSMANYLGFIIPPYAFAFHTGRVTTSVMEDDSEFNNNYFARRNVQAVIENVYRMIKMVKKQAWKVFQEFTHPLSEDEACGIFDLKKEMQRFEDNNFFRNYNQEKGLI
jgi:multimeric flavodoxin WrbA